MRDSAKDESHGGLIRAGAVLKDRYRLERLLGLGGMASVWLAYDQVLERDVAVKVLSDTIAYDPDFVARFRREAKVAAGLTHPHLIGIWDYAEAEERPFLVMEYVAGENLAQRMSEGVAIDCERLARELLGALTHIHAAGIVHRDVKPQNILLGPEGEAKLIDFGIALPRDATALTQTGQLLGTARFAAPEVMSGAPATQRSDLYSCGVVLRDCLGDDPSKELQALVARLTSTEPRDRPASAAAALAALGGSSLKPPTEPTEEYSLTEELAPVPPPRDPPPARPDPPPRPPPPVAREEPRRSSPAWGRIAAVAALLLTVGAIGALVLADGGEDGRRAEVSPVANADSRERAEPREPAPVSEPEPEPEPEPDPEPDPRSTGEEDPARGSALNQEGFEMIQAGQYEEAVPVLEEAVASFPAESEELEYGYALFNLGNALRLSGRPDEAIPILERRLQIPDQIDVVREELAAAESDAAR